MAGQSSDIDLRSDLRSLLPMVVAAAIVVFGGLATLRILQGPAVAEATPQIGQVFQGSPAAEISVDTASGDQVITAEVGDSMWSIAQTVAPERDPRPVVAALIEANGGDSVQIGQQIVIPGQLLD